MPSCPSPPNHTWYRFSPFAHAFESRLHRQWVLIDFSDYLSQIHLMEMVEDGRTAACHAQLASAGQTLITIDHSCRSQAAESYQAGIESSQRAAVNRSLGKKDNRMVLDVNHAPMRKPCMTSRFLSYKLYPCQSQNMFFILPERLQRYLEHRQALCTCNRCPPTKWCIFYPAACVMIEFTCQLFRDPFKESSQQLEGVCRQDVS